MTATLTPRPSVPAATSALAWLAWGNTAAGPDGSALPKVLVSRVTAPLRARTRPSIDAPVVTVIDVSARMLPVNAVPVPSVADEPTCQKTLLAWTPPVRTTEVFEPVMRVLPAWKMNTEPAGPSSVNGTVPVSAIDAAAV